MIALPDVDTLMAGGLQDRLDALTADRAKAKEKMIWTGAGGIVSAILVGFIFFTFGLEEIGYFAATVVGGGALAWASHIRQKMIDSLKHEMNGALGRSLQVDYSVSAFSGQEFEVARKYGLLPTYDDKYLQDQWHGSIEGTDFLLYEAKLTEEQGSGKNRRTVTKFEGVVLRFQFARPFLATTLVRRDGFKMSLFGDNKTYDGQTLERIKMVDPGFEDAFDVYGTDQVEARYLVHPAYCERLIEMEREFEGDKLAALFHGGDLIVTLHTGDMFESATLSPQRDRELLGKTIAQFGSIAKLVKLLNERPRH
ncbi:DUF3137 domain-containing protein [Sphingorhabdus sp.]|uniref:DUF3137 domain-containing protein n=1 Tax=Sphingorhabdus sp. TaxID=1902408 RepID=UPI0035941970